MLFSNIYERYVPALNCPEVDIKSSIVFMADSDKLLMKSDKEDILFPCLDDFNPDLFSSEETEYLGLLDTVHCFCLPYDRSCTIPEGFGFQSLRTILGRIDENTFLVASRAIHIAGWSKQNKYCGVCGGATRKDPSERARRCPSCGNTIYPRISPAIIIAVVKGNQLLLAHNKNFREGWYSTIAGFIEPGESIEACAEREVYEEAGIKINNIRYFASQPWPFPDSLMIGLTAEYESGEVMPDGTEIDDAGFFDVDRLPDTPGKTSIAGRLIEWFVEQCKE